MKVTKFQPQGFDAVLRGVLSGGVVSEASNAYAIGGIVVEGAAGSNYHIVAYSSNYARWIPHDAAGGGSVSFGSNAMSVADLNVGGASTNSAREDHRHQGIATITASSSNTMQRPTLNLRPGTGVSFGLTSTDGDAALDTITINSTATGGGGGSSGITHSYVGYNTAGGSLESMTQYRMYCKKITLATDGMLASIGAYLEDDGATHVAALGVALFDDNSNAPGKVIGFHQLGPDTSFIPISTYGQRWVHMAIGMWLTAASYWMGVYSVHSGTVLRLAYDASGSDQYFTQGGAWVADATFYSITTSGNAYSIRGSIIR